MEYIVSCAKGFERLLADELIEIGIPKPRALQGQVSFFGELEDAYTVCLNTRIGTRVLAVVARIGARDADELYEGLSKLAWDEHLYPAASLVVRAKGGNDALRNSQFIAMKVKDALMDWGQAHFARRFVVDKERPDVSIFVRVSGVKALVAIDISGESLAHRGYSASSQSPLPSLRSDYAAALLRIAGVTHLHAPDQLVLGFVGNGILACEAEGILRHEPAARLRVRWGFEGWKQHQSDLWKRVYNQAIATCKTSHATQIRCFDTRSGAAQATRYVLRAAGYDIAVEFDTARDVAHALPDTAVVVADVSWMSDASLTGVAKALKALRPFARYALHALSANDMLSILRNASSQHIESLLGSTPVYFQSFDGYSEVDSSEDQGYLLAASEQFATRLAKVYKQRKKWAAREGIDAYRLYDADLPDYALAIDLFTDIQGKRWVYASEYAAPKSIDPTKAYCRILDALTIVQEVCEVPDERIVFRVRSKAKGGSQYASPGSYAPTSEKRSRLDAHKDSHRKTCVVQEGGLEFELDFSGTLDCGLFLDHRITRGEIRELMKATQGSRRFLNLFAYTGSATCYAADGAAGFTTTVDLSTGYLARAERNMKRNGFIGKNHEFIQADALQWIQEQRHSKNRWDLIFCDVPTFSNSSRMKRSSFDVQRDHVELIIGLSRLLIRGGLAIFSCNLTTFKPDVEALARAGVELLDITERTIPEDFARHKRIHHCFEVRRVVRHERSSSE